MSKKNKNRTNESIGVEVASNRPEVIHETETGAVVEVVEEPAKPVNVQANAFRRSESAANDTLFTHRLTVLSAYVEEMRPGKPISVKDGIRNQQTLWRLIQEILNLEGVEFIRSYSALLDFINDHRDTVFSEAYAFRFMDTDSGMHQHELMRFQRMLSLILTTCDRASRQLSLTQVNLSTATSGLGANIQGKLQQFYYDV